MSRKKSGIARDYLDRNFRFGARFRNSNRNFAARGRVNRADALVADYGKRAFYLAVQGDFAALDPLAARDILPENHVIDEYLLLQRNRDFAGRGDARKTKARRPLQLRMNARAQLGERL